MGETIVRIFTVQAELYLFYVAIRTEMQLDFPAWLLVGWSNK